MKTTLLSYVNKALRFYVTASVTAATLCLMDGCNHPDAPLSAHDFATESTPTQVNLTLGVSAGMTNPRELNTWEPAQQVNDMRIYVFRQENPNAAYTLYVPQDLAKSGKDYYAINAFDNRIPYHSKQHDNKPEQHLYQFDPKLEEGFSYKFLAIGRDDKYTAEGTSGNATEGASKDATTWGKRWLNYPDFTPNVTTFDEANLSLSSASQSNATLWCTELFTGKLDKTNETGADDEDDAIAVTAENKTFSRTITLTRAVAGLMLYLVNIPSLVEDNTTNASVPETFTPTQLTLEATAISNTVCLANPSATNQTIPPSEAKSASTLLYNKILALINLTESNGWSTDATTHLFTRAADEAKGWKANSYMVSNFMMPTPLEAIGKSPNWQQETVTFYLHYTDGTHHRYDNVKISTTNGNYLAFPIQANHLYSLGAKSNEVNEPYDLKENYEPKMEDITLEIEPAFEKKHHFTLN